MNILVKIILFLSLTLFLNVYVTLKYAKMFLRFRRTRPYLQKKIKNYEKIVTIFFQGHGAARSQGAKYFGKEGIATYYNEHNSDYQKPHYKYFNLNYAPQILYNAYPYKELTDIKYGCSFNPLKISTMIINVLKNFFIGLPLSPLYHMVIEKDNLAGKEDIEQLTKAIKCCINQHPNLDIVVFGCSRGASTVFSTIALLDTDLIKHIKLVILEAPFDNAKSAIKARFGSYLAPLISKLMLIFTSYNESQKSPISLAPQFPLDIPVGFIMGQKDEIVPMQLTENLINTLKKRGHQKIHENILKNSHHTDMALGDTQDQMDYKKFVDDLYEKYIQ